MNSNHDYQFQELVRLLDATLATINPSGLHTGHNALKIIDFLANFEGMDKFVSKNLYEIICKASKHNHESNVRSFIKECLMYPKTDNSWTSCGFKNFHLEQIHKELEDQWFQIKLVDDEVRAECKNKPNLSEVVFNMMRPYLTQDSVANEENCCHIVLVDSKVVRECGKSKVIAFLKQQEQKPFRFNLPEQKSEAVKQTFLEDWSVFSNCLIINLESSECVNFLFEFNQNFHTSLNPSLHIIFAVQRRNLFLKI